MKKGEIRGSKPEASSSTDCVLEGIWWSERGEFVRGVSLYVCARRYASAYLWYA